MDVSLSLGNLGLPLSYGNGTLPESTPQPPEPAQQQQQSASSASANPLPAEIQDAPSPSPAQMQADVANLSPAIKYAPSPAPHVGSTHTFERTA